ncbi:MAG: DUF5131 family protein, partial [Candidatus Bathyarchaeia archaeon]
NEKMFGFLTRNHKKSGDTWNPLGGKCLHSCRYCWVEKLKVMFPGVKAKYSGAPRLTKAWFAEIKTFTKEDFVFVCDCTDLFGHWVPTELIQQILDAIKASPAKFLLLTKNPQRYQELISIGTHIPLNCVLGCTVESDISHLLSGQPESERLKIMRELSMMGYPVMLSIEPVMKFNPVVFPLLIALVKPKFVACGYDNYGNNLPEPTLNETLALIDLLEKSGIVVHKKSIRKAWFEKQSGEAV